MVWWVVELRFPPLRLALLGTSLVLTILLAEAPTGVLADLYGRKRSVVASFAVMGAAIGLMASSPAFASMMVWQAVWALGWTMQSGAATAWVTDELPAGSGHPTARDTGGGRSVEDAASRLLGGSCGHAGRRRAGSTDRAARHVASDRCDGRSRPRRGDVGTWSLRGALVVVGTLSLAFAAYLAVTMAETGFVRGRRSGLSAGGAWREALTILRHGAALALRRRTLLAVVSAAAITGFASEAIERLDTLRLVELGLPDYDGGEAVLFFGVVWFIMAALSIPVMMWLRRRLATPDTARDARLLSRLLIVAGAGALALAVSPIFAVALAGWTILDVAGETTYPLAEAMANREATSTVRATVVSFLGQAEALGQVIGGVSLGLVAQYVSLPVALGVAAGLLAVAAIPVAVVGRARPAYGGVEAKPSTARRIGPVSSQITQIDEAVLAYMDAHSSGPDALQQELIAVTEALGDAGRMQIGAVQGSFMTMLVRLLQPRLAVEVGTFTGYSALAVARGLPPGGRLLCCDVSEEWTAIARSYLGARRRGRPYRPAYRPGAGDAAIPAARAGSGFRLHRRRQGQLHQLLRGTAVAAGARAGVILVDNVLWGGSVANPDQDDDTTESLRAFNAHAAADPRSQVAMLPVGDGLTVITLH